MTDASRVLIAAAGLSGALGVGLSAMASHAGGSNIATAGSFLVMHAPALLALSLLARNRLAFIAGLVLVAGLALFAGDLVMRERMGRALFPMAAPIGGGGLILGWVLVAAAGLLRRR